MSQKSSSTIRKYIDPKQFVITAKQIAKMLNIDPQRIVRWEKWQNVLWVHIKGKGGYFVSYRRLEQWIAACSTLIRFCPTPQALETLWLAFVKESQRYQPNAFVRVQMLFRKRFKTLTLNIEHF